MSNYPYLLSDKSLTVIINNLPFQTDRSNPHWDQIKVALEDPATDDQLLIGMLKPITAIASAFENHDRVRVENGNVFFGNEVVSSVLATRILDILKEGLDVEPWVRFANNVYENPNDWSREELYLFLERCNLPITQDGCFIAYKKVKSDYTDCHSGRIDNSIGQLVVMPGGRHAVDPDRDNTCSVGLHFCSKDYLSAFGGQRVLLVKINPADVVSIPSDYNNAKGRCWRYEVVGEIPQDEAQTKEWAPVETGYDDFEWGYDDDSEYEELPQVTRCVHCNSSVSRFDKAPKWSDGWATDITGDIEEDFICPARQTTGRHPDGKPHEVASISIEPQNVAVVVKTYDEWLASEALEDEVPVEIEVESTLPHVKIETPHVKIETLANGVIDRQVFDGLLVKHGTLANIAKVCGLSTGTVQAWKKKLYG